MSSKVNPIRGGYHSVTPYLCIDGAADAIEFYKSTFDAEELMRMLDDGGEWQDINELVPVNWIPCNYGGYRPLFRCPGVLNGDLCNRRGNRELPRICRSGFLLQTFVFPHGREAPVQAPISPN